MVDIVNLRAIRKRARRRQKDELSAANRLAHGRSKAERKLIAARAATDRRTLDAHRIDTGDNR